MRLSKEEIEALNHINFGTKKEVNSDILISLKEKGLVVGLLNVGAFDAPDAVIIGLDTELTPKGERMLNEFLQ